MSRGVFYGASTFYPTLTTVNLFSFAVAVPRTVQVPAPRYSKDQLTLTRVARLTLFCSGVLDSHPLLGSLPRYLLGRTLMPPPRHNGAICQ